VGNRQFVLKLGGGGQLASGLPERGRVINKVEIDVLLLFLRQELDQVDRAIVTLETMARLRRAAASPLRGPIEEDRIPISSTRNWSRHRRRAS
jgi:hypothetical protein